MNSKKLKKIRAIEKRVPQEWRDALTSEEYVAPDLREEALNTLTEYEANGETNEKDYLRLRHLFDAGYYDKKELVVNEEMAKKIEDFMDEEIDKAIASGELPPPEDDNELKEYVKKLHKNGKKQTKRSIRTKRQAEAEGS